MKWRSLEEANRADTRTLGEILAERKEMIAKYVGPETQRVHERVIAELKTQEIATRALAVGAKASGFELKDQTGHTVSSTELLSRGRLVVCFYRGRWCPFCVATLECMNLAYPAIQQAGAALVAISPQTVQQSFFMADQHKLRFPLLSDPHNEVARRFGLVYGLPDDEKHIYRRSFVNLALANGDDTWELPVPATFVLDRDGTVLFASAKEDYRERPEPAEIVRVLAPA